MPSEDDGLLRVARGRGPDVPCLVGLYLRDALYLLQLAPEPLAGLLPLLRPRDAAGSVGAACELGELLQLIDGAAGFHPFGLHQPTLADAPSSARASSK